MFFLRNLHRTKYPSFSIQVFRYFLLCLASVVKLQRVSPALYLLYLLAAHLHHARELYKTGYYSLSSVMLTTFFQAFYTTLFGILSSFLFLRTGHLTSAVVSHALCNVMGFPDFENALQHRKKIVVCSSFLTGLIMFIFFLFPLTEPKLFGNRLYV